MVRELKKFKFHTILVKINDWKKLYSSANLIASDWDIEETFKYMHQSIMKKIKIYASHDRIALDVIIKHSIIIFEC